VSESENSMATTPPFPLWARESGLRNTRTRTIHVARGLATPRSCDTLEPW
jgi:hypothetical protein